MKVVLVGPAYPLRGGIADFNEALYKGFIESGHACRIFSFYFQYPSILFPGKTQFSTGPSPEGISIDSTISSINPFSWIKTAHRIIAENPDLVIVRYWLPFMAPALGSIVRLLRTKKIKVIAITDNVIPHEKRPGDKMLTRYFVKGCQAFVTLSQSVSDDLNVFVPDKPKVFLPHPIYSLFGSSVSKEDARKELNILPHEKLILFFGFIRPYKGLDLLLEAMHDSRVRDLGVRLMIAGEFYENEKHYAELLGKLGDKVILHTSFISKEKVKNYFCAADLVVQPYRSATQSGITQIAYHFNRPMLVTNVGGLAEIVLQGKVGYVTEISATSIADAILDFYNNNRESEFSKNAQTEKARFSWTSFVQGIIRLYETIR